MLTNDISFIISYYLFFKKLVEKGTNSHIMHYFNTFFVECALKMLNTHTFQYGSMLSQHFAKCQKDMKSCQIHKHCKYSLFSPFLLN